MPQYLENTLPSPEHLQKCVDFFHEHGYLVIPYVLSPERCQRLREDLDNDIAQQPPLRNQKIFFSDRIFERSQANLELFALEPVISFAEKLIGDTDGDYAAKYLTRNHADRDSSSILFFF